MFEITLFKDSKNWAVKKGLKLCIFKRFWQYEKGLPHKELCTNILYKKQKAFCSCYFWRSESVVVFQTLYIIVIYFFFMWIFFWFSEKTRSNRYCLWEVTLFFNMQIWSLIYQSVNLSGNLVVQKIGCAFAYFLLWTEK